MEERSFTMINGTVPLINRIVISLLNGSPLHLTLKGMQDIVFRSNIWMIGKLVVTLQPNIHANTYLSWQQ